MRQRPTGVRDPLGRTTQMIWSAGSLAALLDAKQQKTSWTRDVQGRITAEVRADGTTTTTYAYESATGRQKTITDPKAQVTTYTYAPDSALLQVAFTSAAVATPSVSYTYDALYPRIATMVDGIGTTAYTYRPVGTLGALQPATVDGPFADDTMTYGYDELGRVLTRLLNGTGTTIAYDALGRVATMTFPIGAFTYTYDGHTGRVSSLTYPNGQTSTYAYFGHTGDHRLQTIHHQQPGGATLSKFDYTYDAVGNIATWRQERMGQTPFVYVFGYDLADQLLSAVKQSTDPTPTVLVRQAWGYDVAGNRTTDQTDDAVFTSTHDVQNRLLARVPGGAITFAGTLNEPGSVLIAGKSVTVDHLNAFRGTAPVSPGTTTVQVIATDASSNSRTQHCEVDASGSTTNYSTDANGNQTSNGIHTYIWDARNQLVCVQQDGVDVATFVYDALGRRVQKTAAGVTRTNIYDADNIVEERAGADVIRYAHGPGVDNVLPRTTNGSSSVYYLADHHSVKRPLEGRVWFRYPDQRPTAHHDAGSGRQPSVIAGAR